MAFAYTASTRKGELREGEIDLATRQAVIDRLESKGLVVISVAEIGSSKKGKDLVLPFSRVKYMDVLLFTKHLAVMLQAGLSLIDALRALADQTKNPKFRRVLNDVVMTVERGESLSSALGKYSKIFSPFYVHVVEAGELSGTLEQNLNHLAEQSAKDYGLRKRVKSALLYPSIVFGAALLIGFFFAAYVLPQVSGIFTGLSDIDLPWVTELLLALSSFVREYTLVSFVLLAGIVYFFWWLLHRKFLRPVTHYLTIHLPVVGPIAKEVNLARFSLMLGTLLRSGLDIVRALEITREVLSNVYYKEVVAEAHLDMQRGITLRESLQKHEILFPGVVLHMIDVGERSGELESVLNYLAEFYELEVDTTMKNLSSVLEPVLLLFIGLVALGLAYAILIPIYNYISAIRSI